MEYAKIGTLTLTTFDKDNREDLEFIKRMCQDETIRSRFQGIMRGLSNEKKSFFDTGFLVKHDKDLIGYIHIGNFNELDHCVYLRSAVDKDKRGLSYGKTILSEITEYIFQNYPQVESIRLKIAIDNKPSLMTANSCGYLWLEDDFYIKYNPYMDLKKTK